MSKKLYHYCDLESFLAIISNKCIRLSDLSKSNDYMERKWIGNIIEEALNKQFKDEGITINLREEYWYADGITNHIAYLIYLLKYYIERSSYITCFSRSGDLLSQWRAYGDDGRGMAIGFDSKLLRKADSNKNDVYIEDVLYDKTEQIEEIQFAVAEALIYMRDLFNRDRDIGGVSDNFNEYFVDEFDTFCEVVCDDLDVISCYVKNPAFKEENEVRIFYAPQIDIENLDLELPEKINKIKRFNNYILKPINFYARRDQIIGYADLSFEKLIQRGIVSEIVIGPSSRVTIDDIYYVLAKNGYDFMNISVKKSEASYRLK